MKSAEQLKNNKQAKLQQMLKEKTERINMELIEIEKAQNKWESDMDDNKPYFEIPIIIKTQEVKDLLHKEGYIIDKVSNDIQVNTSRIYVDKELYRIAVHKRYTGNTIVDNKEAEQQNKINYPITAEDWINGLKNLKEIQRRMCY